MQGTRYRHFLVDEAKELKEFRLLEICNQQLLRVLTEVHFESIIVEQASNFAIFDLAVKPHRTC